MVVVVRALNLGACFLLVLRAPPHRALTSPSSRASSLAFFASAANFTMALTAASRRGRDGAGAAALDMATCRGAEAGGASA